MLLKRLEAYGFKSFADKVEIEFDKGITAVVGPNGSGKSNITDAIRWVLGEQNIRALRGLKSEDIIFTGSNARRPSGVAEVSLSFLNDGTLPVDYNEVNITRRFFRSGESEYYINKTRCRLKDIFSLFADTGLGQDGMSVISQNKIDEILNSKPEERRLFFEETAGITKYRARKKEAMRKLEDTEQNYIRVNDIVQEIETQLEPLSEQAEKTRKYNELRIKQRQCNLTLLCGSYDKSLEQKEKLRQQSEELRDQEIALVAANNLIEARKQENGRQILALENDLQQVTAENSSLHDKIEKVTAEIRLWEERRHQRDINQKRLVGQQKNLTEQLAVSRQEKESIIADTEELLVKQAECAERLGQEKTAAKEMSQKIKDQKTAGRSLNEQREALRQEISEKQKAYALLERDIEADIENSRLQGQSETDLNASLAENQSAFAAIKEKIVALTERKAVIVGEQKNLSARQKKLTEQVNTARQLAGAAQQYAEQAETKIEVLKNMQQAYEGFGKAAKVVLKSHESWRSGVCGAVAELITVPQQYITAVDVALGAGLQNIVTDNAETAKRAIEFLKRSNGGRVTFLPLDTLEQRKAPDVFIKATGVIGWLNEIVKVEEKYRKALDFLLARTLLVDNIDHALSLAKKQQHKVRIVTVSGELLNPGGSISGGSYKQQESGFLNRSGEIANLQETLTKKKAEAAERLQQLTELKAESEKVYGDLAAIKDQLDEIALAEAKQKFESDKLQEQIKEKEEKLARIAEWKARRELTFAKAQERKVLAAREIRALSEKSDALAAEAVKVQEKLSELEQEADDLGKEINESELQKAVLGQQVIRSKEKGLLIDKTIKQTEKELSDSQNELKTLELADAEGQQQVKELQENKEKSSLLYQTGLEKQKSLYDAKMSRLAEAQDIDKEITEGNQKQNKLNNKIHALELDVSKVDFEIGQMEKQFVDDFSKTPAEAKSECLDLKTGELKKLQEELQDNISALGMVNPQAIEEYESRKTRYDFLRKQLADLAEAKQNLLVLVKEINQTMTKQFNDAFGKIRVAFNDIFVELFGGGKAELELTDDKDVLNSGVEIIVQLPEKKQQNLSALSGGERALTVIALLFSFLRVKPAPFSVLDEIDAPLDEANIARFSKFLHDFADNTQFIIVTHRKRTMEAADVMYGVTLEDAGVSKLISVRLGE